jgi:ribosome biogenesis protein BRX1
MDFQMQNAAPEAHTRSKCRVMSFYVADNKVWIRNYQIVFEGEKKGETTSLVEIGPRFVLTVIRIFDGR